MVKPCIKFYLFLCILSFDCGYSLENKSPILLIIDPNCDVASTVMDSRTEIDLRIASYSEQFPEVIYDYLVPAKEVDLRTQFDELTKLKEQILNDSREDFIKVSKNIVHYQPDAYLFTSINKTIDEVIIRAEILDLSSKPLAIASKKIRFRNFFNDSLVIKETHDLTKFLILQLTSSEVLTGEENFDETARLSNQSKSIQLSVTREWLTNETFTPNNWGIWTNMRFILKGTFVDEVVGGFGFVKYPNGYLAKPYIGLSKYVNISILRIDQIFLSLKGGYGIGDLNENQIEQIEGIKVNGLYLSAGAGKEWEINWFHLNFEISYTLQNTEFLEANDSISREFFRTIGLMVGLSKFF